MFVRMLRETEKAEPTIFGRSEDEANRQIKRLA